MWYWEILFVDAYDNVHSIYSTSGFHTQDQAIFARNQCVDNINLTLEEYEGEIVADDVIWRNDETYTNPKKNGAGNGIGR